MWRDIMTILALLALSPIIGIAASIFSLLFFVALPIWIAWRVFLENVLKRDPGLYRFGVSDMIENKTDSVDRWIAEFSGIATKDTDSKDFIAVARIAVDCGISPKRVANKILLDRKIWSNKT